MPAAAEKKPVRTQPLRSASKSWTGRGSGDGWFVGPAYLATEPTIVDVSDHLLDGADLLNAIASAATQIESAMNSADPLGSGMLEFQAAMLRDPELARPALARIADGETVILAWAEAMGDYIAAFQDAGDGGRTRYMDLVDMRNRVLAILADAPRLTFPVGSVFVGEDMEPSIFLEHDWMQGGAIALSRGSLAGHIAILAKSRGIPLVCGLEGIDVESGQPVLVDASLGLVVTNPDEAKLPSARRGAQQARSKLSVTSGPISLFANINQLGDLDRFDPQICAGVGLVRTEFLFGAQGPLVDEEAQLSAYRQVSSRFAGPSWIRLFDFGGDKPAPGVSRASGNSLFGRRGVRLLLAEPGLLRPQAQALLRTAAEADIGVLVPMVTVPDEIEAVRAIFQDEAARLAGAGIPHSIPPIGMMVEVPAAAVALDSFKNADFFSIGTNDLLQYTAAVARDDVEMHDLRKKVLPAILLMVETCVAAAAKMGKPLSVCGDLAGDPARVALLTEAGVRRLSIGAAQFPRIAALFGESARHD